MTILDSTNHQSEVSDAEYLRQLAEKMVEFGAQADSRSPEQIIRDNQGSAREALKSTAFRPTGVTPEKK